MGQFRFPLAASSLVAITVLCQTILTMIERHLFVLKYMYKTPILATCERCHFRFFTSLEMFDQPVEALENLWRKFNSHICKPVSFRHKRAVQGVA